MADLVPRGSQRARRLRQGGTILAAGAAVGAGLQQAGLWQPAAAVIYSCVIFPAVVLLAEQGWLQHYDRQELARAGQRQVDADAAVERQRVEAQRQKEEAERQRAVDRAIDDLVLRVSSLTRYDIWGVGVSAWEVLPSGDGLPQRLNRFGSRRFADDPQPSDIVWTCGKGVVGRCWERQKVQHEDLRAACRKYPGGNITDSQHASMGDKVKMGMSLAECRSMLGKYGEVLAVPIKDGTGALLGCLTVDVPYDDCDAASTRLNQRPVKRVTTSCGAILGRVLRSRLDSTIVL